MTLLCARNVIETIDSDKPNLAGKKHRIVQVHLQLPLQLSASVISLRSPAAGDHSPCGFDSLLQDHSSFGDSQFALIRPQSISLTATYLYSNILLPL